MKNKIIVAGLFSAMLLGTSLSSHAQNLIANPGFETGSIPTTLNQVPYATDWEIGCGISYGPPPGGPQPGTPDLFDSRSTNCEYDIPINKWGNRNVRTAGTYRYVGFSGANNSNGLQYYSETVKGHLLAPLSSGITYNVSFWASAIDGYYLACGSPYPDMKTPDPVNNKVEVVLRKDGDCTTEKIVFTSASVSQTTWTNFSGNFTLSSADEAVGYNKIEYRLYNNYSDGGQYSHIIYLDDVSLTIIDPNSGCASMTNVVTNGNFSAGNTGFTSDLPLNCTCAGTSYCVSSQLINKCNNTVWTSLNFSGHTSGTDNFLIVDGNETAPSDIWYQNVNIIPNMNYTFSFWARSLYTDPFAVQFVVNGIVINTTPSITQGVWTKYSCPWFSGTTCGTVSIRLRQKTGGLYRDFGVDDISFAYCGDAVMGCQNSPTNLATNPNFTAGNTGFISGLPNHCYCSPSSYCVGTQAITKCTGWAPWNFTDHTSGTGNFLMVDGSTTSAVNVWVNYVTVVSGQTYTFSFWARELNTNPIYLGFMIGGTGVAVTPALNNCGWTKYTTSWTATTSGSIQIAIRQIIPGSNMVFGIDDIFFGTCGSGSRLASSETDNAENFDLNVFPNPNNGSFIINTNSSETKDVFVYDMTGKLVFQQIQTTDASIAVDITGEAKGLYLVKVIKENMVQSTRIINE